MRPLTLALSTCALAALLGAGALVLSARMDTPPPLSFALVAYRADAGGALHAETLESGLSPSDCAFALGAAARLPIPAESLITCEPERFVNE